MRQRIKCHDTVFVSRGARLRVFNEASSEISLECSQVRTCPGSTRSRQLTSEADTADDCVPSRRILGVICRSRQRSRGRAAISRARSRDTFAVTRCGRVSASARPRCLDDARAWVLSEHCSFSVTYGGQRLPRPVEGSYEHAHAVGVHHVSCTLQLAR
jgi:hypothetical protein